jgi:hypothetical protein
MINDTNTVMASKTLKWHAEGLLYVERLVVKARRDVQECGSDIVFTENCFNRGSRCVYPLERVVLGQTSARISPLPPGRMSDLHDSCDVSRRCSI